MNHCRTISILELSPVLILCFSCWRRGIFYSIFTISLLSLSDLDNDKVTTKKSGSEMILTPIIFPTSFQNRVISDIPIECAGCQFLVDKGMFEEYRNHHRTAHFEGHQIKSASVNHGLAAVSPGIPAWQQRLEMSLFPENPNSILLRYPPKCSVCHRLCSTKRGKWCYLRHYRAVHLKIKEYSCGNCGKEFSESGNLDKHQKKKKMCKPPRGTTNHAKISQNKGNLY